MAVLPPETVERLLVRPEDMPSQVEKNVNHYRSAMLRLLEDHMADHDQQYLVELDGNQPVAVLEKVSNICSLRLSFGWQNFEVWPFSIWMRAFDDFLF